MMEDKKNVAIIALIPEFNKIQKDHEDGLLSVDQYSEKLEDLQSRIAAISSDVTE